MNSKYFSRILLYGVDESKSNLQIEEIAMI
jgi:hypothetical protein